MAVPFELSLRDWWTPFFAKYPAEEWQETGASQFDGVAKDKDSWQLSSIVVQVVLQKDG